MTLDTLIRIFAEHLSTGLMLTEPALESPGPVIRYVNPAFCRLTGYEAGELIGGNPRILQGEATQPLTLRSLSRALHGGQRFHGVVSNYRKSGEHYLCEIDIRPVHGSQGAIDGFLAFGREVVRVRGRPREDGFGRFRPTLPEDSIFHPPIDGLTPFATR
jgi:PAS domain S-box-containing protein